MHVTFEWRNSRADDPASNGSAITSYRATASSGQYCESATTTCNVLSLANGTPVTFIATATNGVGMSSVSTPSDPVTPATVPGPPLA